MLQPLRQFFTKYFAHIIIYQVVILMLVYALKQSGTAAQESIITKRWGGFDERPMTDRCYRQQGTATLLAFFIGWLGVDQFYAHHWGLAVGKLLIAILLLIFIAALGEDQSNAHNWYLALGKSLTSAGLGVWVTVDIVLWVVGGVYATPGCPGGFGG